MITVTNLKKQYRLGRKNRVDALRGVNLEIAEGEVAAIIGPSGSGKSTLLNILGGLDRDYQGTVEVFGKDIKQYNKNFYRRNIVQTVFQQFYLVPSQTVYENVVLPVKFGRQYSAKDLKKRADFILDRVGLKDRRNHRPNELSGGQAQRVAIARALITNPTVLLADEPTGNLDTKTGKEIVQLLFEINKEENNTLIIITHDPDVSDEIKRKIHVRDGIVV